MSYEKGVLCIGQNFFSTLRPATWHGHNINRRSPIAVQRLIAMRKWAFRVLPNTVNHSYICVRFYYFLRGAIVSSIFKQLNNDMTFFTPRWWLTGTAYFDDDLLLYRKIKPRRKKKNEKNFFRQMLSCTTSAPPTIGHRLLIFSK